MFKPMYGLACTVKAAAESVAANRAILNFFMELSLRRLNACNPSERAFICKGACCIKVDKSRASMYI